MSFPSVTLTGLSFAWPDGTPVFDGVTAAFGAGRTGLLGVNGTGKSTLLALIAGELTPSAGTLSVDGNVGYLPQQLVLRTDRTVADLLGIGAQLRALAAIESGDPDPAHFDVVGDGWDVQARAQAMLEAIGLGRLDLGRSVGTLSGGETVLTALAALKLAGDDIVLLDEPSNNLDRGARRDLYEVIASWRGALIVVSHDVELLDLMDQTAELRAGELTTFGGNYTAFREHIEAEQAAAEQALRTAEQKVKAERRQRVAAQTKLAHRERFAKKAHANKREPKIIMNQRKREAQVSAGKLRTELDEKVAAARRVASEQAERIRSDDHIRIALPDPGVPRGRRLAELSDGEATVVVQGPERLALIGRNGVGKTRLLEALVNRDEDASAPLSVIAHTDRIGYLPQRLDHLDDDQSILDAVAAAAPSSSLETVRANLAKFLFRGEVIERRVGELSGGERFRVALAQVLLAEPANQLLILDEPTNSLDLRSIDELVSALDDYRGGLIVVSHDDAFLRRLGIDTSVELRPDAAPTAQYHRDSPVGVVLSPTR